MFRDGYLTEASASNVLVVRKGKVIAPPKDNLILPGITYDATAELARDGGLPFEMRPVKKEEALSADEMWLSSSTKEVLAVTTLRPLRIGRPRPGTAVIVEGRAGAFTHWNLQLGDRLEIRE